MKLAYLLLASLPLISHAAKLRDFAGEWKIKDCFYHGANSSTRDGHHPQQVSIDFIKETKSLLVGDASGGLKGWPVQLDDVNGKGISQKTKGECFDLKEEGVPLFKSCVVYTKIIDANLEGSTVTHRDILKESWVRPFSTTNGKIQELKLSKSKNELTYSYYLKRVGSKKELYQSCNLERL